VQSDQPITVSTELSFELIEGDNKIPANVIRVSSGRVVGIAFGDNEMVRSQVRRAMETDPWRGAFQSRGPHDETQQRPPAAAQRKGSPMPPVFG
jgi:hypothetical protein